MARKDFKPEDVESGREYVKAYVEFIHYAERLFQAALTPTEGHSRETRENGMQQHMHK